MKIVKSWAGVQLFSCVKVVREIENIFAYQSENTLFSADFIKSKDGIFLVCKIVRFYILI